MVSSPTMSNEWPKSSKKKARKSYGKIAMTRGSSRPFSSKTPMACKWKSEHLVEHTPAPLTLAPTLSASVPAPQSSVNPKFRQLQRIGVGGPFGFERCPSPAEDRDLFL